MIVALMLFGSLVGVRILRTWNPMSTSEEQLILERQTYLVSVLVAVALWIEIGSALLFIHTVDDLHELFVGAMCATGTLNANPVGWWVLAAKGAIVLLFPIWLAVNGLDQRSGSFPLVRLKYGLLLVLTPLAVADLSLQIAYFGGLQPDIITSCCGALFSESSDTVTGDLAAIPAVLAFPVFLAVSLLFLAAVGWARVSPRPISRIIAAVLSPVTLAVGVVAVISFVSVAYYELPTHHCPFDLFQSGSAFVGYPLMFSLVAAVVLAAMPGALLMVTQHPALRDVAAGSERRWLTGAAAAFTIFLVVAIWPLVFGNLAWESM